MNLDFRRIVVSVEWLLALAFMVFVGTNSWSSSESSSAIVAFFLFLVVVNETMNRLARRAERRRGLRH